MALSEKAKMVGGAVALGGLAYANYRSNKKAKAKKALADAAEKQRTEKRKANIDHDKAKYHGEQAAHWSKEAKKAAGKDTEPHHNYANYLATQDLASHHSRAQKYYQGKHDEKPDLKWHAQDMRSRAKEHKGQEGADRYSHWADHMEKSAGLASKARSLR